MNRIPPGKVGSAHCLVEGGVYVSVEAESK